MQFDCIFTQEQNTRQASKFPRCAVWQGAEHDGRAAEGRVIRALEGERPSTDAHGLAALLVCSRENQLESGVLRHEPA
jgi:hypothetical protein